MSHLIEIITVRVRQNFDVVGGLNPVQIEIEDDKHLKKKTKMFCICIKYSSWLIVSSFINKRYKTNIYNRQRITWSEKIDTVWKNLSYCDN